MAIPKQVRDKLLVDARHRCTICSEKCFELHHIIEQAEGGTDTEDNLLVLCPNCHQHRYHRSGEFTRDQLRLYKAKLGEAKEIERRLLLNIEEIKSRIGTTSNDQLTQELREELTAATKLVDPSRSPTLHRSLVEQANDLATRLELLGGARRAIQVEFDLERQRLRQSFEPVTITGSDEGAYKKSSEFPAAYRFVLVLNHAPDAIWTQLFDQNYHHSFYSMKRKTTVHGSRITMIVADSDNLQTHVDFAKQLVQTTNTDVENRVIPELVRRIDDNERKALAEYDAIQSLKSRTKGLSF
jgi:HNH endonuclease